MSFNITWLQDSPTAFQISIAGQAAGPANQSWNGTVSSPSNAWSCNFGGFTIGLVGTNANLNMSGYGSTFLPQPNMLEFSSLGGFGSNFPAAAGQLAVSLALHYNGFTPSPGQSWVTSGNLRARWGSLADGFSYTVMLSGSGPAV
jgi:hypothetical protein